MTAQGYFDAEGRQVESAVLAAPEVVEAGLSVELAAGKVIRVPFNYRPD